MRVGAIRRERRRGAPTHIHPPAYPDLTWHRPPPLRLTDCYLACPQAVRTTAVKDPSGKFYVVNGEKKWITNGKIIIARLAQPKDRICLRLRLRGRLAVNLPRGPS